MRNIANQLLRTNISGKHLLARNSVSLSKLASMEQLNVYGAKGYGFVVISKDDDFTPVLGYSDTDYEEDHVPCGFKWWLRQVDQSLCARKAIGLTYQPAVYTLSQATNFIKTSWNQEAPYNALCPKIDGKAAPTGCIATAMAQIMYYFQYPESGKGKGAYTVTTSRGKTTYESVINDTYAWSKMKIRYGAGTIDIDNAVATLMRDAGAASRMIYSDASSGTTDFDAAIGFCENFRFDSLALKRYGRDFYSDDEWMGMVRAELEAKCPILYCGQDAEDGGHAFILDGINEEDKVHVNWGWSGSGNGWYDINVLKPTSYSGSGLSGGDGFNESQSMVFGFKTQETPDETERNTSLWVTDGYSFRVEDNKLIASLTDAYNYGFRYFSGIVGIVIQNIQNDEVLHAIDLVDTQESNECVGWGYGYTFTNDNENAYDYDLSEELPKLPEGTYRLYLGSKSTDENGFQYVRGEGGIVIYTLTIDSNGNMSVAKGENTSTGINHVKYSDKQDAPVHLYDINGISTVTPHGLFIVKQGSTVKKIIK